MKRSLTRYTATALLILCAGVAPLLGADGARSEPLASSTPSIPVPAPAPLQRPVQVESNAGPGFGSYSYDAAGNITTFGTHTFQYDVYGRLKKATLGGSASAEYTYDRYGNILTIVTDGQTGAALKLGVDGATNKMNVRQNPVTGEWYTYADYDAAGNVTSTQLGDTYVYDGTNVMTESTVAGTNRLYLYTASGERLAAITMSNGVKQRADWTVRDPSGKVLRRFTELASSGWKWEEDYIYRGGQLLAAEIPGPDKTLHFHLDHLGTPRLITGNGGAQIAEHAYYPFGPEQTSAGQDTQLLKFTGHERDASSLDYMHARYYTPGWGRFLSVDPRLPIAKAMRSPQRWNRYAYVSNNPLKNVDPDGREQVTFGDRRTELLFNRLEARNPQVRATLGRYRGEGTPDLHIQRGNAGIDIDGKTKAKGVLNAKIEPSYDIDKMVKSGAKQDESALMPATGIFLSGSKLVSATLTLDSSLTQGSKQEQSVALHELGHAEGAAANPDRYLAQGANDVVMVNGKLLPHDDRPLEKEAEQYRTQIEPP